MSIVVNADMPSSCGTCRCSGTDVCREWLKVDRNEIGNQRADSCPITCEIPNGKGRLIELEELIEVMTKHKAHIVQRCIDMNMDNEYIIRRIIEEAVYELKKCRRIQKGDK